MTCCRGTRELSVVSGRSPSIGSLTLLLLLLLLTWLVAVVANYSLRRAGSGLVTSCEGQSDKPEPESGAREQRLYDITPSSAPLLVVSKVCTGKNKSKARACLINDPAPPRCSRCPHLKHPRAAKAILMFFQQM